MVLELGLFKSNMDRITPEKRSYIMSRIRGKNTKPELLVFRELRKKGVYFQKHYKVAGRPDVAFPRKKVAVFINGEFWHGRRFKKTKDRLPEFWREKIERNIKRDRKNYRLLKKMGGLWSRFGTWT
jgi:DNA mismatch endonuclease (patch repair protein)